MFFQYSELFVSDGRNCFDSVLFYGNEATLVSLELLLFCLIDLYCLSYITGGLTVFIIFKVINFISGRGNF